MKPGGRCASVEYLSLKSRGDKKDRASDLCKAGRETTALSPICSDDDDDFNVTSTTWCFSAQKWYCAMLGSADFACAMSGCKVSGSGRLCTPLAGVCSASEHKMGSEDIRHAFRFHRSDCGYVFKL
jgi:hypothetical protein